MQHDFSQPESPVALAAAPLPDTGAGAPDAPISLPRLPRLSRVPLRLRAAMPQIEIRVGPRAGMAGVAALVLATLAVVVFAAAGPSVLVPHSVEALPGWEAGPLHLAFARITTDARTIGLAFSVVLALMVVAYLSVLAAVRGLSMRTIAIAIVALHVILLLSPPMQLSDVFNYIGYARLGALHGLNPYTHGIKLETFDPIYRFTSWRDLESPYGPLFSALTYPLAFVSLPLAYWAFKTGTVLLSLMFVWLVYHCARKLGRDPRLPVAFVALNPIFLIYEVGGFHNDFFMLVPMMAAIVLLLGGRDRSAGAVLMIAVAVKFTAILLLPFLLVAAHARRRQIRVVVGAALGGIPMLALSLALFGFSLPNLSQQSSLLTGYSIPNLTGLLLHLGGATPLLLKAAAVGVVLVVAHQFYRNRDWLAGAGWATLALIASLGWLMPWYVIWLLPLAALAGSVRLRRAALVLTVFLVVTFVPATGLYLSDHGFAPLNTTAGQASMALQHKLAF
ncbi:MAG: glycosyltransferase family 87 protein [Solirubrobacteraceae bacterium]